MQNDYTSIKTCSQCKRELPATPEYFHRSKKNADGLKYACKKCRGIQHQKHSVTRLSKIKQMEVPTEPKVCNTCNTTFPRSDEYWHKNKFNIDGYSNDCQECAKKRARKHWQKNGSEYEKKRSDRIKNDPEYREKRNALSRSWYHRNKEYANEQARKWYCENRDRVKVYRQEYHKKNRKKAIARTSQWRKKNPKRYKQNNKVHKARRRKLEMNATGKHTAQDIQELYDLQHGCCGYCGIPLKNEYHLDHITPLSKGGSNNPDNLMCACESCNLSKADKLLREWEVWREW